MPKMPWRPLQVKPKGRGRKGYQAETKQQSPVVKHWPGQAASGMTVYRPSCATQCNLSNRGLGQIASWRSTQCSFFLSFRLCGFVFGIMAVFGIALLLWLSRHCLCECYLSIYLYLNLSLSLFNILFPFLCVCLCQSLFLSIFQSLYLTISQFICLPFHCLSHSLSPYLCLTLSLFLSRPWPLHLLFSFFDRLKIILTASEQHQKPVFLSHWLPLYLLLTYLLPFLS